MTAANVSAGTAGLRDHRAWRNRSRCVRQVRHAECVRREPCRTVRSARLPVWFLPPKDFGHVSLVAHRPLVTIVSLEIDRVSTYVVLLESRAMLNRTETPFQAKLPESSLLANQAFTSYLRRNARASLLLHRLHSRIRYFLEASPRLFVSKCIDGRVHTSDEKGYPANDGHLRADGRHQRRPVAE